MSLAAILENPCHPVTPARRAFVYQPRQRDRVPRPPCHSSKAGSVTNPPAHAPGLSISRALAGRFVFQPAARGRDVDSPRGRGGSHKGKRKSANSAQEGQKNHEGGARERGERNYNLTLATGAKRFLLYGTLAGTGIQFSENEQKPCHPCHSNPQSLCLSASEA